MKEKITLTTLNKISFDLSLILAIVFLEIIFSPFSRAMFQVYNFAFLINMIWVIPVYLFIYLFELPIKYLGFKNVSLFIKKYQFNYRAIIYSSVYLILMIKTSTKFPFLFLLVLSN